MHDDILIDLDKRRRALGLSHELLARKSGVSRPTVQRILTGRQPAASFENVAAIAEAVRYCHENQALLHLEADEERTRLEERGIRTSTG